MSKPRIEPGKAFRAFFHEDDPTLPAKARKTRNAIRQRLDESQAEVSRQFEIWLQSDEFRRLKEQTRETWLRAGIDVDEHQSFIGRFRLLVAKACPELLKDTFREKGGWFNDDPPGEWFASLFELACRRAASKPDEPKPAGGEVVQDEPDATKTPIPDSHPLSPPKEKWPREEYARDAIIRLKENPELQSNVSEFCRSIAEEKGVPEIAVSLKKLLYQSKYKSLWRHVK